MVLIDPFGDRIGSGFLTLLTVTLTVEGPLLAWSALLAPNNLILLSM